MIRVLENLDESSEMYKEFFEKHGIETKGNSLGFSEKEQKWYGWSHRAIHGFKVGDVCKDSQCGVGEGYTFKDGDKLKTLDDCKQRAIDFAKSID